MCIKMGSIFLYGLRKLKFRYNTYFIEASSYKDKLEQGDCEVGKKIIIVDELFDNGRTLFTVKNKVLNDKEINTSEENVFTCVLLRKAKPTKYAPPDFIGLDSLPNLWVVGYGLDFEQEKRLYAMPSGEDNKIFSDKEEYKKMRLRLKEMSI